jgi:hypothetical protein
MNTNKMVLMKEIHLIEEFGLALFEDVNELVIAKVCGLDLVKLDLISRKEICFLRPSLDDASIY